ncbi:MAG: hypothetical protein IPO92_05675 [Saprospiraceae bacterium]|nr:hypothetical protein [Saprospiraceae bacterium]
MRYSAFVVGIMYLMLCSSISCKIQKAYTNGQEGLETVHQKGQIRANADYFKFDESKGLHASINYSPIKNVGIFYDLKSAFIQHQYHTLALGYYLSNYKKLELIYPSISKPSIDIGRHFDFYGGMSYGYTKNSTISYYDRNTFRNNQYELNYFGKRYFVQLGGHLKAEYIAFDFVWRQIWLDPDKIEIYGLGSNTGIDPVSSFSNSGYRSYSEISLKMNLFGHYKPFYVGMTTRFGNETQFTGSAFSSAMVFIGANMDIYHIFTKKGAKRQDLEYIYKE